MTTLLSWSQSAWQKTPCCSRCEMHAGFHCAWKFCVWLLDLEIIKLVGKEASAGKWTFFLGYTLWLSNQTSVCKNKTEPHTVQMWYEEEAYFSSICSMVATAGSPCCLGNDRLEPRLVYPLKRPCNSRHPGVRFATLMVTW